MKRMNFKKLLKKKEIILILKNKKNEILQINYQMKQLNKKMN